MLWSFGYQEKLTKDRKGHKENQDELGTEVSKEDKANLGTYWKIAVKKLEVITGSDTFWDGSIPNPLSVGIPTSVSQTTPETSVAGLRNHLTSDLVPKVAIAFKPVKKI
jgi:hypothetical protein